MSLLGSIQLGANTLRVNQLALQVVGQNIANANTPGYIREEAILTPAPTERRGSVLLGMGVRVEAVVQKLDRFLEDAYEVDVDVVSDGETVVVAVSPETVMVQGKLVAMVDDILNDDETALDPLADLYLEETDYQFLVAQADYSVATDGLTPAQAAAQVERALSQDPRTRCLLPGR